MWFAVLGCYREISRRYRRLQYQIFGENVDNDPGERKCGCWVFRRAHNVGSICFRCIGIEFELFQK